MSLDRYLVDAPFVRYQRGYERNQIHNFEEWPDDERQGEIDQLVAEYYLTKVVEG